MTHSGLDDQFDVIVVGVGAMGSSACFELARRGMKVLGLEQFAIAHERGSAHGQSRMIRMAYYEHPDYVPLLARAYERWQEAERLSGERLLHITGGLYAGPSDGEVVPGSEAAARTHGLQYERLSASEAVDRFPLFRLPQSWSALFEPMAGFLLPEHAVSTYVKLARQQGAVIRSNEPVLDWQSAGASAGGPWRVRTNAGVNEGKRLIFCGGAWSGRLMADLGVPLQVTRQVMGWVRPADPEPFRLGRFPVWAIENLDRSLQYGFPVLPGESTLKVSWHGAGPPADPDTVDRTTSGADVATFLPQLPHVLPTAAGPVAEMRVCLYTNSPDHHFIVDRHPTADGVYLACGFSGHGFKFASVIGEILADFATRGTTAHPVRFLSLDRFRQAQKKSGATD